MLQTVDVDATIMMVVYSTETTIPVCGLSCFCAAVAAAVTLVVETAAETAADVEMTAAYGLSCF